MTQATSQTIRFTCLQLAAQLFLARDKELGNWGADDVLQAAHSFLKFIGSGDNTTSDIANTKEISNIVKLNSKVIALPPSEPEPA